MITAGMEVVCIYDDWVRRIGRTRDLPLGNNPVKGQVYWVREVIPSEDAPANLKPCTWITLREFGSKPCYPAHYFRPVVKSKRKASTETGMEILRAIRDGKLDPGAERERLKRRKARVRVDGD